MYQDRAALIATSQLPLIVALAGKNNLISCKSFILLPNFMALILQQRLGMTGIGHEKVHAIL
jgi:hypothetical protein